METKKLSKSLTDNRFGGWGWSMIGSVNYSV